MASNPVTAATGASADSGPRTPFVLGAIGLTFALYIILRGDLERYAQIFLGTPSDAGATIGADVGRAASRTQTP